MSYYDKYMKYKMKYTNAIKQIGGGHTVKIKNTIHTFFTTLFGIEENYVLSIKSDIPPDDKCLETEEDIPKCRYFNII